MADTRNKSRGSKADAGQARPSLTKRGLSRKRLEEQKQRRILLFAGSAVGLALLIVVVGVLYDQLWVPSRPVARINDTTLTTREYWQQRRLAYAQEVYQNLQLLALFGGNQQISGQFANQSPAIDQQVANIRSAPVDQQVVESWIERELITQGATELGVEVQPVEVMQAMAVDLGAVFAPPPTEPLTPTETLSPTVAAESEATAAADEGTPEAPTGAAASPTPASSPTTAASPTLAPTPTTIPTPAPDEAESEVEQALTTIYDLYTSEITQFNANANPQLSQETFRQALEQNFRQQVFTKKIEETLVPAAEFEPSREPTQVQARQIFIEVPLPPDAGAEARDAAFAEARDEVDTVLAELEAGAEFNELVETYSDDPGSREQGGDLGSFDRDGVANTGATYPPELVEAAFALEEQAISEPVRTEFGWHILQLTSRTIPSPQEQLQNARSEAFDEWLEAQRAEASIQRFPEATALPEETPADALPTSVPTFLPGPPTPMPTPTLEPTLPPTEAPAEPAPAPTATP